MRPLSTAEISGRLTALSKTANSRFSSASSAKLAGVRTAFLCHSHKDHLLAEKLIAYLAEKGINLYVDWKDHEMPAQPNRQTAERIQKKIEELDLFLYLATSNSSASKWCPWEIGCGDKAKGKDKLLVIPTKEGQSVSGQEYLALYRSIQIDSLSRLVELDPATKRETLWRP